MVCGVVERAVQPVVGVLDVRRGAGAALELAQMPLVRQFAAD